MAEQIPDFDPAAIEALLTVIRDGVWFWHADTGYVYRCPGWYTMLGYDPHSLENTVFTWEKVIHPDDYQRVMEHFEQYVKGEIAAYSIEYRCMTKTDKPLWIKDTAIIIDRTADGNVSRMIGAHQNIDAYKRLSDISSREKHSLEDIIEARTLELSQLNKQLEEHVRKSEYYAMTDFLTSLSNRYSFEQKLSNEIARSHRFQQPLSLMVLDLDNFKSINDKYGHPKGDEVLVAVGDVLAQNIRQIDIAARWGGDEFAMLLPNTPLQQAVEVAEKLRLAIKSKLEQLQLTSSASFGVVELLQGESQTDFVRRADMALYQSKNDGRNKVSAGH